MLHIQIQNIILNSRTLLCYNHEQEVRTNESTNYPFFWRFICISIRRSFKTKTLPGHVLIHVKATSVNPIDTKMRSGAVSSVAPEFPAILHGDVAGIVIEVGEGVSKFKTGDEVYGCAGGFKETGGALAEFMLAGAKVLQLLLSKTKWK